MSEYPLTGDRLFLIGSEATKAMSAALWNGVLAELGRVWHYESWDVPRGNDMAAVRARLLRGDVIAANITMPHKHWAALAADTASESVRQSGASNLLIRLGETLSAHNTDASAVMGLLGPQHRDHVLMLGAGGAARAALVALQGRASLITIADRDPHASAELATLASDLGMPARAVSWPQAQHQASHASLLINATPMGKAPGDPPVWGGGELAPDAFAYDFVYARHVTASIAAAREQGLRCADGWDHLQGQAAAMVPLLGLPPATYGLIGETLQAIRAVN